jgi:2,3-dihydroxy-p-cumate/2,3-dihydroxybenzoate 3,4-dioxygenase
VLEIEKLGYLSLSVIDLDEAIEFYSRFVRLELTERIGSRAFMTGGSAHHWIRLEEGSSSGVKRIAYAVRDEETLRDIKRDLDSRGMPVEEGGDFAHERVYRWLRLNDPGGFPIELYTEMAELPQAVPSNGVVLEKLLHGGWRVPNFDETAAFYQDALGFRVSDWLATTVGFFRCADQYHHSLVLIRSPDLDTSFDHLCIQVGSIDDVMRFRHNAVKAGVPLRSDLLRHPTSDSISVYMRDVERGISVEFCTGHRQITDENHRPRRLPVTSHSTDVWSIPLPEITTRLERVEDDPLILPSLKGLARGKNAAGDGSDSVLPALP